MQMQTIASYLKHLIIGLKQIYSDHEAKSIAEFFVCEILHFEKIDLILKSDYILSESELSVLHAGEIRLLNSEPVQYVTNKAYFMDLEFFVEPGVLIPRQETEVLVNEIKKDYQNINDINIIDICTGSGCIAISLAKYLKKSTVSAIDNSQKALKIAKNNAESLNTKVRFYDIDILSTEKLPSGKDYDIIVCNPPYVRESEKELMHKNVLDFEPAEALFVNDNNPFIFFTATLDMIKRSRQKKHCLYFEINEKFGREIFTLLEDYNYTNIRIIKDLNNKDRFVTGKHYNSTG
jgi:release factor glutamine methyltransferase